ncbi:MAG TPA: carbamate kinase [Anaerolineae bacterium]|nr:carbamate kinase [Anaerolineae bacterium]
MTSKRKTAVVAIGGNSLIMDSKQPDVPSQWEAVRETCWHIADMIERGWDLVITHGNGPQVGFILRRNELAEHEVHPTPLDVIGADTQGSIGYMISQALGNEFRRRGLRRPIAALVTQVLVDRNDPAFQKPTKGIGGFTSEEKARAFEQEGWSVIEDAGRGWRRVIASPMPLRIVELDAIRSLIAQGFVVVAVGGGGVPVTDDGQGGLTGARAVIDKDRATSLLAQELKVDLFLISTGVAQVAIDYSKPERRWLSRMTLSEARRYLAEKQFPPGSMGPKIEAVIDYLEAHPAGRALITDPPNIARALDGQTGTWLVSDSA